MKVVLQSKIRSPIILLALLLCFYLAVSLRNLAIVPPVYEDEPWQASTGWKLATEGVFGSDIFAGLHGMEHRYYGFMPVHPLLLAGIFRAAGLGLLQARFETVLMGLLTLILTYALGKRLYGSRVGLLAVVLLLFLRLTGLTRSQLTGILLLDMARIARYDMVVPVFGLLSLHAYLSASRRSDLRYFALAGLLAGLAGLSHLYGAFWIICLGIVGIWDRVGWRGLAVMVLGFGAPWLAYLAYLLSDVTSWAAQFRGYANRFDLLNPNWYWNNLVLEYRRYGPGLGPPGWHYALRPGFWAAMVALPASLAALAWRGIRLRDREARVVVVPALLFPVLFALLISLKLVNYTITVLPLAALAVAWAGVALWRRVAGLHWERWARAGLLAVLLAVMSEGATRIIALEAAATTTTPYQEFILQVRAHIPPGSRVIGLHNYWLGLHDLDYRSWVVPLGQGGYSTGSSNPHPVQEALDRLAPDVLLVDVRMRGYLENPPPGDTRPAAVRNWLEGRGYTRAVVEDPTYGRMEILRLAGQQQ